MASFPVKPKSSTEPGRTPGSLNWVQGGGITKKVGARKTAREWCNLLCYIFLEVIWGNCKDVQSKSWSIFTHNSNHSFQCWPEEVWNWELGAHWRNMETRLASSHSEGPGRPQPSLQLQQQRKRKRLNAVLDKIVSRWADFKLVSIVQVKFSRTHT